MFKLKLIFSLLFIGSILVGCDKSEIAEKSKTDENVSPRKNVSGYNYYSVSTWSALKTLLAQIKANQNAGIVSNSDIQITTNLYSGTDFSIDIPSYTTISGGGVSYGVNGVTLFTQVPRAKALFIITGEHVTIQGLIIKGPWTPNSPANSIYSYTMGIWFHTNANYGKVQNCDISGFPGSAITFVSIANEVYANNIHDNNMIINTPPETLGYGVRVKDGGYATIHHNYFDNNQHAITGGGFPQPGYEAYNNQVSDSKGMTRSHHFDMHPHVIINAQEEEVYVDHDAGNMISIHDNVFYYTANRISAISIRGIPQSYCYVYNNAFINDPNINSAVRQIFEYYETNYGIRVPSGINLNMYVWNNVCDGYPGDPYTTTVWLPGR